jgi:cytochrome c553
MRDGPGNPGPFFVCRRMRFMTGKLILAALGCMLPFGTGDARADVLAGRAKARMCVVCHGEFGVSVLPNAPNLAGQPEAYLAEQLKAYRSGRRSNEMMSVISKPLTDAEIADLAAWFASIAIEAKPPK